MTSIICWCEAIATDALVSTHTMYPVRVFELSYNRVRGKYRTRSASVRGKEGPGKWKAWREKIRIQAFLTVVYLLWNQLPFARPIKGDFLETPKNMVSLTGLSNCVIQEAH